MMLKKNSVRSIYLLIMYQSHLTFVLFVSERVFDFKLAPASKVSFDLMADSANCSCKCDK